MPRLPLVAGKPMSSANFAGRPTNLTQHKFPSYLRLRAVHIRPQLAYSDPQRFFLNTPFSVLLKKHKFAMLNTPQLRELS